LKKSYRYLALGDSYTIGELVPGKENFPNQLATLLRQKGFILEEPVIIAKTGWTTDELQSAIRDAEIRDSYDWVTLLIGVNNQYRGRIAGEYAVDFESLLDQSIRFAGNNWDGVIVLSIPDWGVTPFAKDKDRKKIAAEIDEYNAINERIAKKFRVHYINITDDNRVVANAPSFWCSDGLHPSGKEYENWAKKIKDVIMAISG
jgi:lysophospholipase L1-like esterase